MKEYFAYDKYVMKSVVLLKIFGYVNKLWPFYTTSILVEEKNDIKVLSKVHIDFNNSQILSCIFYLYAKFSGVKLHCLTFSDPRE